MSYGYHRIIRKIIVAFGDMFNNINLYRYDDAGNEVGRILVPILYGGKEKYVSRLEGDPNLDKKVQITLPVISYELTGMHYDATKKLNTNQKIIKDSPEASGGALGVYNPVPFDFEFKLLIYVRNFEDGAQIIERVLPFFTPDYTLNVNLIPEMGIVRQLPITLKDVEHDVDYEGDFSSDVRRIIWTLTFNVKGYLYGAVSEPKIIRKAITNIFDDETINEYMVSFTMNLNDAGDYKVGETVYQGYSLQTATAWATVVSWQPTKRTLVVRDFNGHFVTGQKITGLQSLISRTLDSYALEPVQLAKIVIDPNPLNVILPNTYTYVTTITESPNL